MKHRMFAGLVTALLLVSPAYANYGDGGRAVAEASRNEAKVEVEANRNEVKTETGDVSAEGNRVSADENASGNNVAALNGHNTVVAPAGNNNDVANDNVVVAPVTAPVTVAPTVTTGPIANCAVIADCSVQDNDTTDNSIRDSFNREECTRGSCNRDDHSTSVTTVNSNSFNKTKDASLTFIVDEGASVRRPVVYDIGPVRRLSNRIVGGIEGTDYGKGLPLTGVDVGRTLALGLSLITAGVACLRAGRPRFDTA